MKTFDKYKYYIKSVQSPEMDVKFFDKMYKKKRGKRAVTLREDFCGTFLISCEWVKLSMSKKAIGVELSTEPIKYGMENHMTKLSADEQTRINILEANVLSDKNPKADIVAASNFSYFCFKDRKTLKEYFARAYESLNTDGMFVVDCFGGSGTMEPNEEETEHKGFSYYWDQDTFDPVTNFGQFYIHFKRDGEPRREKVFSYDWRMWSIPEIKDLMLEVGFKEVLTYWEGTTKDGEGDGKFKPVDKGEDCESWVSYIAGVR